MTEDKSIVVVKTEKAETRLRDDSLSCKFDFAASDEIRIHFIEIEERFETVPNFKCYVASNFDFRGGSTDVFVRRMRDLASRQRERRRDVLNESNERLRVKFGDNDVREIFVVPGTTTSIRGFAGIDDLRWALPLLDASS